MSNTFSNSMRSLDADNLRRSTWGLLFALLLLASWVAWSLLSQVSIYESTDKARLEVDRAIHPIEAPIAGRVIAVRMAVGQEVLEDDLLVELDARNEKFQITEEQDRIAGYSSQLEVIRKEIKAEEETGRQEQQAAQTSMEEARNRSKEAEVAAAFAEEESKRLASLQSNGLIPEVDLLRAKSEYEKRRAAADTLRVAINRLEQEQKTKDAERLTRIERLKRDAAQLSGDINTKSSTIGRLEYESGVRLIRAPVSGRLAEVGELRIGAYVEEGDKLGAVLPSGELRIVAQFLPHTAIGRIQSGQKARLRLDGFPWTQYGSVSATVTNVAKEARDGLVRVELKLDPNNPSQIPLQHGLPGSVEIEVEKISPAILALRTAGKLLLNKDIFGGGQ